MQLNDSVNGWIAMIRPKSGDALDEEEKALKRLWGAVEGLREEIKRGFAAGAGNGKIRESEEERH